MRERRAEGNAIESFLTYKTKRISRRRRRRIESKKKEGKGKKGEKTTRKDLINIIKDAEPSQHADLSEPKIINLISISDWHR